MVDLLCATPESSCLERPSWFKVTIFQSKPAEMHRVTFMHNTFICHRRNIFPFVSDSILFRQVLLPSVIRLTGRRPKFYGIWWDTRFPLRKTRQSHQPTRMGPWQEEDLNTKHQEQLYLNNKTKRKVSESLWSCSQSETLQWTFKVVEPAADQAPSLGSTLSAVSFGLLVPGRRPDWLRGGSVVQGDGGKCWCRGRGGREQVWLSINGGLERPSGGEFQWTEVKEEEKKEVDAGREGRTSESLLWPLHYWSVSNFLDLIEGQGKGQTSVLQMYYAQ